MEEGLDPADVLKPLSDSWPPYSGDLTGRRYSSLTQINQSTVKNLTLSWTSRLTAGSGAGAGGFGRGGGGGGAPIITGGVGTEEVAGTPSVKGSILQVNGILYVTAPDKERIDQTVFRPVVTPDQVGFAISGGF